MEAIIRQIYAQWVIAKEQARQECESRSLHNVAEKYRKCNMFKGTERSIEELSHHGKAWSSASDTISRISPRSACSKGWVWRSTAYT